MKCCDWTKTEQRTMLWKMCLFHNLPSQRLLFKMSHYQQKVDLPGKTADSMCLSFCLSVLLFACLRVCLSVCLPVCLSSSDYLLSAFPTFLLCISCHSGTLCFRCWRQSHGDSTVFASKPDRQEWVCPLDNTFCFEHCLQRTLQIRAV